MLDLGEDKEVIMGGKKETQHKIFIKTIVIQYGLSVCTPPPFPIHSTPIPIPISIFPLTPKESHLGS